MPNLAATREHGFAVKDPVADVAGYNNPSLLFALIRNSFIFMLSDLGNVGLNWLAICWFRIKSQPRIAGGRNKTALVRGWILWQQRPVRRNDPVVSEAFSGAFACAAAAKTRIAADNRALRT
jgi:hypothetical protein